jgi:signal recognition particle subunit SRP54
MTLDDFLDQMRQMKKMGGMESLLSMLPGGAKLKNAEFDEAQLKKPEAIICSMTKQERRNPSLLNASRRKRIAAGSGTTVQDVNALMNRFDQARTMMKRMMTKGGMRELMRSMK